MRVIEFDLTQIENFNALLFDLDGTLVDSMPAHNKAWQQALNPLGVQITEEELYKLAGTPNLDTAEIFISRFSLQTSPEDLVFQKENYFENSFSQLKGIEAVVNIVKHWFGKLPMGVVSGSTTQRINESLNVVGLDSYFDQRVTCDDTQRGKPFPDPYLLGAKKLGVSPQKCLVFEDGDAGIKSAQAAQMSVVYVKNGYLYKL